MALLSFDFLTICPSLSFYKEELVGETSNYVHLRSAAEQRPPMEVLRLLSEEVLDTAERIDKIIGNDQDLRALWQQYLQVRSPDNVFARMREFLTSRCSFSVILNSLFEHRGIAWRNLTCIHEQFKHRTCNINFHRVIEVPRQMI